MNKKLLGYLIIIMAGTLFVRTIVYFLPQIQSVSENVNHGRLEIIAIIAMVYMIAQLLGFAGMITLMRNDHWPDFQKVQASNGHVLDQLSAIPTLLGLPYIGSALWSSNRVRQNEPDRLAFTRALDFHFSMTLFLIPSLLMINLGIGAILLPLILIYWIFCIIVNTIRIVLGNKPVYPGAMAILNRPPKEKKAA